jgi:ornithine cyclodeaminase/alanine dehydrogenase-like protein (mu-crystallin family)
MPAATLSGAASYPTHMPLWLSESDVRQALSMTDLIEAMQTALAAFSAGEVIQPVRTALEFGPRSFFAVMPACDPAENLVGAKLVTVVPDNAAKGLPSHQAIIALFDRQNGELLALVDGRYITEARTAAVSAVSARYLAREGANTLAIIGSGVQALSHREALPHVRDLHEIRAWSPNSANAWRFAAGAREVQVTASAEDAVRGADIVVLATSALTPVIRDEWVGPGTHVIGVGACRPNQREMEGALLGRAKLVVDSRAAALVESGDLLLAMGEGHLTPDCIYSELGEIAGGRKPGRQSTEEITVFKSLGLAIEDVVSAGLAYRRALQLSLGRSM